MKTFKAQLDILPPSQHILWPQLSAINREFVLYGGTALALRLGHRQSVDFDFFTHRELDPDKILSTLPFLKNGIVLQSERNSYTFQVPVKDNFVKISFFGTISFGRIQNPEWTHDRVLLVASAEDLLATKLKVIMQRIETKDYQDVAALIKTGNSLSEGLEGAQILFGNTFSPVDCLRALEYFEDPLLDDLGQNDRKVLKKAVQDIISQDIVLGKKQRIDNLY
ncbi:MAG: nucleotidyl transferase AbiEii/AbiGii toxin family protein [Spirochaetia bacterium]|nr:nucleotidyl transferase AbiEii/AbiGii toxin family protein [Spirochaetia bacterium]MCF7953503.1 nucleotidyl transferase AbiEii/AbiGii toxin family protein [Spirochaetales bacterium]